MKRVAFIIGSMGKGGAERVISILSNAYIKKGWQVDIIMLLGNSIEYQLSDSINVIDLSTGKSKLKSIPSWYRKLRKYAKYNNPNVMIAFSAMMYFTTLFSTLGLDTPLIVTERSDPYSDGRSILIDMLVNWLYPKARVVVLQTERAKSYFSDKVKANSVIIPNPIEVKSYASSKPAKKIVNVGRLIEAKNQKLLINAFYRINKEYPEYILYIYGDGVLYDDLKNQINKLGINNRVFLEGNVANIHDAISDAEFFVLSSNYEGLSNALLESMMMGIPCISTNCAGSDEYIIDGISGYLVPVGDEDLLYDSMKKMIINNNLRKKLANNGKMEVEKCKVENIIVMWEKYLY